MLPKWATDKTMEDLVAIEGRSLEGHIREVNKVAKNLGLNEVTFNIRDLIGQKRREQDKVDRFLGAVRRETEAAMRIRAVDPIRGFSEVAEVSGRMIAGAGDKVGDFSSNFYTRWAKAGKIAGGVGKVVGKGVTGMAAFGGALAPLINAQEKNLRAMLEYGMMFDDGLRGATEMRGAAADFGMSIPEVLKGLDGMRHVFVNTEENLANSAMAFTRFTANLASASRNDGPFNQFGLIGTDFIKSMGNLTTMFFELGELDSLNMVTRKKVAESFTTTQKIALAMADMTGTTREQLIQAGLDAERRDDVTSNLLRNKELLEEKYGEGVTVQMQLNADFINANMAKLFPSIAGNIDKSLANFTQMLPATEDAFISLPQELAEILTIAGGGITQQVTEMIRLGLTGKIDQTEIAKRIRDIAKTAGNLPNAPAVGDPTMDAVNKFINEAVTVPGELVNATDQQIEQRVNEAGAKVEAADDSIEAQESAKVAFRSVQDQLLPGYEKLSGIFAVGTDELGRLKKIFEELGIINEVNETTVSDELKKMEEGNVSPNTEFGQTILDKEGGYGGVFDPQTGLVIPDDQVVPDRLSTGPKTAHRGPAPSKDPTIEMAPAEVPAIRPGDRVHQIQNKTARIRRGPLSDALLTILKNAAIVTDPALRVEVTSGGQMPLEEWEASGEKKSRKGKEYLINGKAVRTGSRRHDGGDAADLQLRLGDHLIPYTHPKFLQFTEAFFALGGKAGSADHDYMGKHRGHFDIVGTSKGGGVRWNASAGFAQAQDSGMIMASRPEANPYLQRLQEIEEATNPPVEKDNVTVSNVNDNRNNVNTSANTSVPDDGTNERMAEIEKAISAEKERISRSESGENEYWGSEERGRRNSTEYINELTKELQEMVKHTQASRTEDVVVGAQ